MATEGILDIILHNILVRLPIKTLLRFRCVSVHCNRLITDHYFMKSRLRRMIIIPTSQYHLTLIDDTLQIDDKSQSTVTFRSPFRYPQGLEHLSIAGTCNGIIVLLVLGSSRITNMILYNPLTRVSKKVPDLPSPSYDTAYTYGFGYGATPDDLKIVRIGFFVGLGFNRNIRVAKDTFAVFDLKKNTWNTPQVIIPKYHHWQAFGMFLNGFLYWGASNTIEHVISALNVNKMVFSKIWLPHQRICGSLGSLNGCLCMMSSNDSKGYDLWVMKEQGIESSWSKASSFTLNLEGNRYEYSAVSIMDHGRILIRDSSCQFYIYDTSKNSRKPLNVSGTASFVKGIEYIGSLVSP